MSLNPSLRSHAVTIHTTKDDTERPSRLAAASRAAFRFGGIRIPRNSDFVLMTGRWHEAVKM